MARAASVDEYMAALQHARKPEVEQLRRLLLTATPDLVEHIKWNAPSYMIDGDDRVTMRLQPGDRLQLILHRGARLKDASGFAFTDAWGLVRWRAADRGEVTIKDESDLAAKGEAIQALVASWVAATR